MLQKINRLFYRDRRRLIVSGTLFVIASLLGYDYVPDIAPFLPTEVLVVFALLIAMPLISVFAPRYRYVIELAAVSNLTFVLIGRAVPHSNFNLANPDVNFLSSVVLYALTIGVVKWLFAGRWSDKLRRPSALTLSAKAMSALSERELWFGLVPTPGHVDECSDPAIVSIDYADGDRRIVRMINWSPPQPPSEVLLHVLGIKPFHFVRFRAEMRGGQRGDGSEATFALRIVQVGDKRRVSLMHEMGTLPLRRILNAWMDDTAGRMLNMKLCGVEKSAHAMQQNRAKKRIKTPVGSASNEFLDTYSRPERRATIARH